MSATIVPDLQTCLLCEDVRQEANGSFFLVGVLGGIAVPALPVTAQKLLLFTRWCCGAGRFRPFYRLMLPDSTSVIASSQGNLEFQNSEDHVTQISVFANVQFQQEGVYWVEVMLDSALKLRFPFPIRKIASPKAS
ncbi:MAG: hypothetical protein IT578_02630 [Verrucomicrobiae bacterium]|nr:hypothetical protein [Verrucomicrobiae bacterium]